MTSYIYVYGRNISTDLILEVSTKYNVSMTSRVNEEQGERNEAITAESKLEGRSTGAQRMRALLMATRT